MYIEKKYLIKKISEFCKLKNIVMTYEEKYKFSTIISRKLDEERVLNFDEFYELLNHNIELESISHLNFDDEIVDIEYIGIQESIDINVTGDHMYYANGILTHNSATGNTDADNSAVSDSMGSVMTADFLLFLLQTPEMKENKEIIFKCTKNRYTGRTDTWMMNIFYEYMRFEDMITENSLEHTKMLEDLANNNKPADALDFGIVTADKMKSAEEFAKQEVKNIVSKDMEILSKEKTNPLMDSTAELFKELGIEL